MIMLTGSLQVFVFKIILFIPWFQVESYWDECLALPSKLKDWDAYNEMKAQIQQYLDVFPLLHKLASKVGQS